MIWHDLLWQSMCGLDMAASVHAGMEDSVQACSTIALYLFQGARTAGIWEKIMKVDKVVTDLLKANWYPEHIIRLAQQPSRRAHEEELDTEVHHLPIICFRFEWSEKCMQEVWHQDSTYPNLYTQVQTHHAELRCYPSSMQGWCGIYMVHCSCGKDYISAVELNQCHSRTCLDWTAPPFMGWKHC